MDDRANCRCMSVSAAGAMRDEIAFVARGNAGQTIRVISLTVVHENQRDRLSVTGSKSTKKP
jgi:hypothetical protein